MTGGRVWLLSIGFVSVLGQVVLLRELAVASYGVELVYVLAMAVWLFGGALGAGLLGHRAGRAGWVAAALLVPGSAIFLRGARSIFGGVPGAYLSLGVQLTITGLALLPSALVLGALFPAAARSERSLARAYAVESLGGVVGGAASALLLKAGVSNWTAALLCGAVSGLAVAAPWRERPRWAVPASGLILAAAIAAFVLGGRTDRAMTRWSHPSLAATRDTPYGRVSAEERQGLVTVFDNDALAFDTEGTDAEEFVHLAAVEHAAPRRILVLGGAASGVVAQALLHGPERLDAVELDEVFFRLVEPLLPAAARQALASPMVMLNFTDPRAFLEASTVPYDLVLVAMPEPASAATNRYYTREFFELVARHLAPGGVLALRLPAAENLWTPALTRRSASVERALRAAFADVLALPGSRLLLLASAQRLERDPSVLAERLRARVSSPRAATPEYLRFLHTNDRKDEIAALLAASDASPNTDLQPICFRHAAVLWLSRVSPALAARVEQVREGSLAPWIALGLCAAMLLACRIRRRARALGVIALAGFAGMVLETGLLLIYQSRCGVLFEDLGLLLTAFMAGLALGAWAIPDVPKPWTAAALLIALSGLCAAIAALAAHPSALGLFGTGAILACAGSLCGALFAVASRKEQTRWPYAADLLGGCVGAALASLFFFPLLGLSLCAAALVPLALLGLVLAV